MPLRSKSLSSRIVYSGNKGVVHWEGREVSDVEQFNAYIQEFVQPRIADNESSFGSDMQALATTQVATEFVEDFFEAVPKPKTWEFGEAFVECALQDDSDRKVIWPWNSVRDRKTPRASLPGADLVGFCIEKATVLLLFGEVKTSSDVNSPPRVVYGEDGLTWQLKRTIFSNEIQLSLLKWLHARCTTTPLKKYFIEAVKRFVKSAGKEILMVGALVRNTKPNENDFKTHAYELATCLFEPTRVELIAWYLPRNFSRGISMESASK